MCSERHSSPSSVNIIACISSTASCCDGADFWIVGKQDLLRPRWLATAASATLCTLWKIWLQWGQQCWWKCCGLDLAPYVGLFLFFFDGCIATNEAIQYSRWIIQEWFAKQLNKFSNSNTPTIRISIQNHCSRFKKVDSNWLNGCPLSCLSIHCHETVLGTHGWLIDRVG